MSSSNVQTKWERYLASLTRGKALAGLVGGLKLLLLLAPFALFAGCSEQPQVYSGLNTLAYALVPSPFMLFLLVPISAVLAMVMTFTVHQSAVQLRRQAQWVLGASVVSLAGLVGFAFYVMDVDRNGSGHITQFLWGFWGMAAADLVTIGLLSASIVPLVDQET